MQGDFSRFTFDEHKHYNGVLVQQGRVQLDADANEQVAIQAHRDRTEATDTIGVCGVPKAGGGFDVRPLRPGVLDLGVTTGRMYVDGQLCEVGGSPVPITGNPAGEQLELATLAAGGRPLAVGEWIELSSRVDEPSFFRITAVDLAGKRLTLDSAADNFTPSTGAVARRAVTYLTQPDLPGAPALAPAAGDRLLIYLDVWERHVTVLEDPAIREVALGGADTTTRVQTVCQVRFHPEPVAGQLGCADAVAGWPPAASGGRLSATDTAPQPSLDPCRISPDGGFRGLENRLYRIEIHDPGDLDSATFTWSRDNGSVVFAVDEVLDTGGSKVRVRRLGRDDVLTLHDDDWVEAIDDADELAGQPGVLARVSNVNQLKRTLELTPPVPQLASRRHARLRRWDVPKDDSDGVLPVTATPTELEDGVQVEFAGDNFRTGDWWTVPARVLTGRAGPLVDAPPQGITHHYCRLALVEWTASDDGLQATVTDCRRPFPPLTDIEATDVGYDDHLCHLSAHAAVLETALGEPVAAGPVDTVQEALDVLCARDSTYQQLVYVGGDGQEGPPGGLLPVEPSVAVRNAIGEPVPNVTLTFTSSGQGSVPASTATTGPTGEASLPWTLGPAAGLNRLDVLLDPPQGGLQRVLFSARGTAPATGGGLCSFTVGDGVRSQGQFTGPDGLRDAVQQAIAAGGATICVLPGTYELTEPLVVAGATKLMIHGSRLETLIVAKTIMAMRFSACVDVELSDLRVIGLDLQPETDPDALVSFDGCAGVEVQRCNLTASTGADVGIVTSCLLLQGCTGAIDVRDCELATDGFGPLGGLAVRRTPAAHVHGNVVRVLAEGGRFGIDVDDESDTCRIVDNDIMGASPIGIGGSTGGIHIGSGCDGVVIRDNRVLGGAGLGIALGSVAVNGDSAGGLSDLTITGNSIRQLAAGGVGLVGWRATSEAEPPQPITDRLVLQGNHIEACSYGLAQALTFPGVGVVDQGLRLSGAVALFTGDGIRVLDNDVIDNGQLGDLSAPHPVPGIVIFAVASQVGVERNRVRGNASPAREDRDGFGVQEGGIVLQSVFADSEEGPAAMVSGNDVIAPMGIALLVRSGSGLGDVHVSGNHLEQKDQSTRGSNVFVEAEGRGVQFVDNHVVTRSTQRTLVAVELNAGHVLFASNRCASRGDFPISHHVLLGATRGCSAMGNHVLEERVLNGRVSLRMTSSTALALTAVANVTTNELVLAQPGQSVANLTKIVL